MCVCVFEGLKFTKWLTVISVYISQMLNYTYIHA